jgi:hypothetical protein
MAIRKTKATVAIQATATGAEPTAPPETFFKVLSADGKSKNGGSLQWSLPTVSADGTVTPGAWHEVAGAIRICRTGLHLTSDPKEWWEPGCTIYLAEHDGIMGREDDKIVTRRARILRLATVAELAAVKIFTEGQHSVSNGRARASGSASVRVRSTALPAWRRTTLPAWRRTALPA